MTTNKKVLIGAGIAALLLLIFKNKKTDDAVVDDTTGADDSGTAGGGGGGGGPMDFGRGIDPMQGNILTAGQSVPLSSVPIIAYLPGVVAAPPSNIVINPTINSGNRNHNPRYVTHGPTGPVSGPTGTPTIQTRTGIQKPPTVMVAKLSAAGPGEGYYSAAAAQYADQGDGYLNAAAAQYADQGDGYLNATATDLKRHCTNMGGTWVYNGGSHEYECKGGAMARIKNNIGM